MAQNQIPGDPTSVSGRLKGLLATDNPLMQQARTTGLQQANRRGLLNSSMAVGAAQAEMLRTAVPIASQEAAQAATKELTGMTTGAQERIASESVGSQELIAGRGTASQERIAALGTGSQERIASEGVASRETIAGRGVESQERIAALGTGSQETIAALGAESRERIAGQSVASQEFMATQSLDTQREIAALDVASREEIARIGVGSQERIAALNVSAHDRQFAISAITELQKKYGAMWTEIVKNNDIPADAREDYFEHIAALRDSDFTLVEQLYNIDIEWIPPVEEPPPGEGDTGGDTPPAGGGGGGAGANNSAELARLQASLAEALRSEQIAYNNDQENPAPGTSGRVRLLRSQIAALQ